MRIMTRRYFFAALFCVMLAFEAAAQDVPAGGSGQVVTAASFFKSLSDRYAALSDYEADVTVTTSRAMTGRISYKQGLLRIDFSSPKGQTIVFDGDMLIVYLPGSSAVLQQSKREGVGSKGLGLSLISRYYAVQYVSANGTSSEGEGIVQLVAYPRVAAEAFRSIMLYVDKESMLLNRVVAQSKSGGSVQLDFSGYALNTGIPNERFVYDPPSSANIYNNFLAGDE